MMRLAFFCFAIYSVAMFVALRPYVQTRKGGYGLLLLLIAGVIGGVGAGIFTTDPTNAQTITMIGGLHTLCGLTYILGFPIATIFISRDLAANSKWFAHRRWVNLVTILVWTGVAAFVLSQINVLPGYPNRYMVVIYQVWILVVAGLTWRLDKQNKGETKE
jgi:membrane protein implicated in regulation of membrane protease activity